MADLTNVSQIQIRYKILWRGVFRYINEEFMPDTNSNTWDCDVVADDFLAELLASAAMAAAFHTDMTWVDFTMRVRGTHAQVGQTFTRALGIVGTATGNPTPSWLTFNVFQIPDNANREIITGTPSIFKPGRLAFPGVSADDIFGEGLQAGATTLMETVADRLSVINEGAVPADNPGFSATMTRKQPTAPFAPIQRCNILGVQAGRLGHQDTARE